MIFPPSPERNFGSFLGEIIVIGRRFGHQQGIFDLQMKILIFKGGFWAFSRGF